MSIQEKLKQYGQTAKALTVNLMRWLYGTFLPQYTRWIIVNTIYFDAHLYCVQTRTNKRTGKIYFKKILIARWVQAYDVPKFTKEKILTADSAI
jgi:hypothetical protein